MQKLPRTMLTLKKRSDTLRTLVRQGASDYQLNKAAERVREARIRVLRAKIGEVPSFLLNAQQTRRTIKLSEQIEILRTTSLKEILTEFGQLVPKARDDS